MPCAIESLVRIGRRYCFSAQTRFHACASLQPPSITIIASAGVRGPFGGESGGTVHGSVASGWEGLRSAFENNFRQNRELGAQLAVYKAGCLVADLHGYSQETARYTSDTLHNIFSSGKNLEAIACMILVDRRQMKYSDRVADHWPAFAQHGKQDILIEDVLRHESGLQFFADSSRPDDFSKNKVLSMAEIAATKDGAVEKIIEASAAWGFGKRMYHASTRGFVIGGLVRQITGKTLGEFIRSEIAEPLGIAVFCGMPLSDQATYDFAEMQKVSSGWTLRNEVLPALFGFGGEPETLAAFKTIGTAFMERKSPLRGYAKVMPAEWEKLGDVHHVNSPEGRTLEVSSGSIQANARSLAKLGGLLANGGEIDGVRLMSDETVRQAMSEPKILRDDVWRMNIPATRGGFFDFGKMVEVFGLSTTDRAEKQRGFFGWAGKGGSLFLFDVDRKIAFAYVMNGMMNGGTGGLRTACFFDHMQ